MKCPYCFKSVPDGFLKYHWQNCRVRDYEIHEEHLHDRQMVEGLDAYRPSMGPTLRLIADLRLSAKKEEETRLGQRAEFD